MDHTHETDSMDGIKDFWDGWNKSHEKNMKCVHEYLFEKLK